MKREIKEKKEDKILILDSVYIPNDNKLFVQLSRDLLLDKIFFNKFNECELKEKIKEINTFYDLKSQKEISKLNNPETIERIINRKEFKLNQLNNSPLFKDLETNQKAFYVIVFLCFCRKIKGNSPTKTGRKKKGEENIIFSNKNNMLRIDIKELSVALGYTGSSKHIACLKEILKEIEKAGLIKFKSYKTVNKTICKNTLGEIIKCKDIYEITLDDNIFNYCQKDHGVPNRGFIRFNSKELNCIKNCTQTEKTNKTVGCLVLYLALKESFPRKDIGGGRTISFLELADKVNMSTKRVSEIITVLEKNEIIGVHRGAAVNVGGAICKPKNIYTLNFE